MLQSPPYHGVGPCGLRRAAGACAWHSYVMSVVGTKWKAGGDCFGRTLRPRSVGGAVLASQQKYLLTMFWFSHAQAWKKSAHNGWREMPYTYVCCLRAVLLVAWAFDLAVSQRQRGEEEKEVDEFHFVVIARMW